MNQNRSPKVFFSVAETSGDHHAAGVIEVLKSDHPNLICTGLGGPQMEKAGCELLENTVEKSAMMLYAIAKVVGYIQRLQRIKGYFLQNRPDVVVVVDSFAWNSHVAKAAKELDIPVIYYVAPQLWAWAPWRIDKLKNSANQVASILPFEQKWFADRGLKTTYVGHPLFDHPNEHRPSGSGPLIPNSPQNFPTVALLPGSRPHEIEKHWPALQIMAREILKNYPHAKFQTTTANPEDLRSQTDPLLGIEIRKSTIAEATAQADLTIVASGTATLEVAAQGCPMIILYHVPYLQWHLLGRWIINTPHLSLVNILAKKKLVPEFMPFFNETGPVIQTALELLGNSQARQQMREELQTLMAPLMKPGAAAATAKIVQAYLPV